MRCKSMTLLCKEWAKLQGFPDWFTFVGTDNMHKTNR